MPLCIPSRFTATPDGIDVMAIDPFNCCGQQLAGAIAPEAAALRKEGKLWIGATTKNVSTQALQDNVALCIAYELACCVMHAQMILSSHEIIRKPVGLIVWKVVAFAEANTHSLNARMLLDRLHDGAQGVGCSASWVIEDGQHRTRQLISFTIRLAGGDVVLGGEETNDVPAHFVRYVVDSADILGLMRFTHSGTFPQ